MSKNSRRVRDAVKRAGRDFLDKAAAKVAEEVDGGVLLDFFDPSAILVPAPRSAPLVAGSLWPGERIARALLAVGIGSEMRPLISRTESVPKAAYARIGERPSIARHVESLDVAAELGDPTHIVIVDDVVTKGTMLSACATVLRDAFPDADVRGFALLRTMGLIPEVEEIFDPCVGTIAVDRWGNPRRDP